MNASSSREWWCAAFYVGLSAVLIAGLSGCRVGNRVTMQAPGRGLASGRTGTAQPLALAATRPIYPMSVIPGGAFSPAELKRRVRSDRVVRQSLSAMAERLGDPDLLDHVRVAQLPGDTRMHTQLRDGGELCWSEEPVTLAQGERVFIHQRTGAVIVRSRCGNALLPTLPLGAITRPAPLDSPMAPVEPESNARPSPGEPASRLPRSFDIASLAPLLGLPVATALHSTTTGMPPLAALPLGGAPPLPVVGRGHGAAGHPGGPPGTGWGRPA